MTTRQIDDIDKILSLFAAYLQLERGLSDNTRTAYFSDAGKLIDYLADSSTPLREVTLDTLRRIFMLSIASF